MPEFSDSYVALMAEKRLPREWKEGDWSACLGTEGRGNDVWCLGYFGEENPGDFWLPLEGDWLEMLAEKRVTDVVIQLVSWPEPWVACRPSEANADFSYHAYSTRLEALARLYFAVTER